MPEENERLGTIGRARTPEQFKAMQETVGKGKCPFCDYETLRKTAIKEGEFWIMKSNDFPYKHHRSHLVIVYKRHSKDNDIMAVPPEAWAELGKIFKWAVKKFRMKGGGLVMRFGDPEHNASTIRHLHAHIQEPDLTGPAKATFAKSEEKKAQDAKRIKGFVDKP